MNNLTRTPSPKEQHAIEQQEKQYAKKRAAVKYCISCKKYHSLDSFYKSKKAKDGLTIYCSECIKSEARKVYHKKKEKKEREAQVRQTKAKMCGYCHVVKEASEFNKSSKSYTGLQSYCRECTRELNKTKYNPNKKQVKTAKKQTRKRQLHSWEEEVSIPVTVTMNWKEALVDERRLLVAAITAQEETQAQLTETLNQSAWAKVKSIFK